MYKGSSRTGSLQILYSYKLFSALSAVLAIVFFCVSNLTGQSVDVLRQLSPALCATMAVKLSDCLPKKKQILGKFSPFVGGLYFADFPVSKLTDCWQ